jgi:hypothetical protein
MLKENIKNEIKDSIILIPVNMNKRQHLYGT